MRFKALDTFSNNLITLFLFSKLLASNSFDLVCLLGKRLLNLEMRCFSEIQSRSCFFKQFEFYHFVSIWVYEEWFSKLLPSNHFDLVCLLVKRLLNLEMRCSSEIQSRSYFSKQFDHFVSIWVYQQWFSKLLASNHFDLVCPLVKWLLNL